MTFFGAVVQRFVEVSEKSVKDEAGEEWAQRTALGKAFDWAESGESAFWFTTPACSVG